LAIHPQRLLPIDHSTDRGDHDQRRICRPASGLGGRGRGCGLELLELIAVLRKQAEAMQISVDE